MKEIKTSKDNLNTFYYINANSVKRVDGALECKITERALMPIIEKYISKIKA